MTQQDLDTILKGLERFLPSEGRAWLNQLHHEIVRLRSLDVQHCKVIEFYKELLNEAHTNLHKLGAQIDELQAENQRLQGCREAPGFDPVAEAMRWELR